MQLARIAGVSKIFIEEGLGFLIESRKSAAAEPGAEPPALAPAEGQERVLAVRPPTMSSWWRTAAAAVVGAVVGAWLHALLG